MLISKKNVYRLGVSFIDHIVINFDSLFLLLLDRHLNNLHYREKATRSKQSAEDEDDDDILLENNDVNVGASTSAYVDYDKPSTSKEQNVPKWFKATK